MQVRRRFLAACKAVYGEGFEKGYITGMALQDLNENADVALDICNCAINDWGGLYDSIKIPSLFTVIQ